MSDPDSDISFVSSGRPSTERTSFVFYDHSDSFHPPRLSTSPDSSSIHSKHKFTDPNSLHGFSSASYDSGHTSNSSHHKVIFSQSQTYKYLPQYMVINYFSMTSCKKIYLIRLSKEMPTYPEMVLRAISMMSSYSSFAYIIPRSLKRRKLRCHILVPAYLKQVSDVIGDFFALFSCKNSHNC